MFDFVKVETKGNPLLKKCALSMDFDIKNQPEASAPADISAKGSAFRLFFLL